MRLEQVEISPGRRIFQKGQKRLGPVIDQRIKLAVQTAEQQCCGSRNRFGGRFEAAVRAYGRSVEFVFRKLRATFQFSQAVLGQGAGRERVPWRRFTKPPSLCRSLYIP